MKMREASEFWDKHSFLEFDDVRETDFVVELKGEKHLILLEPSVARKVNELARKKKVNEHALVNKLLERSLEKAVQAKEKVWAES